MFIFRRLPLILRRHHYGQLDFFLFLALPVGVSSVEFFSSFFSPALGWIPALVYTKIFLLLERIFRFFSAFLSSPILPLARTHAINVLSFPTELAGLP